MESYLLIFNQYLEKIILDNNPLKIAMRYSLLQNGKRIRPLLFLIILKGYGINPLDYLDIAAAIEVMHISSLVHDDLPEMDNDDYRRGELTNHKKFNHPTALLAGDALIIKAFELILNCKCEDKLKINLSTTLAKLTGDEGLCLGQLYDLNPSLENLEIIYQLKTGNLLAIPFIFACKIANKNYNEFITISYELGLAFQIQDDLQDYFEKGIESDYLRKYNVQESQKQIEYLYEKIINCVEKIENFNKTDLINFIRKIYKRKR